MKIAKRIALAVLSLLIAIPLLFFGIGAFSPNPAAYLTRLAFGGIGESVQDTYPKTADFSRMSAQVISLKDEVYDSGSSFGKMDIYKPKGTGSPKNPTLFWVHGGAFVGGDKNGISNYMIMLASQGYVVVNLNYDLAPESKYPSPLNQIGKAYRYVEENASDYGADLTRIVFGGDSAGGQLVGQFVNMQVDKRYAEEVGIPAVVNPDYIKAVVFFSALLDVEKFDETDSSVSNYLFDKSAWAYFGKKDWKDSKEVQQANVTGNVNAKYPPTYLTDGNTGSFQTHGEELSRQLKEVNVPVETRFYSASLGHEYQFDMSREESQDNYRAVSDFLAKHLE
ncbi:alpha/beta hydrolase [Saccharibacillus kuerlensis]|uniref:Lipase n=1 Tax=Saccharibacillus kuerlensis TaxID=459527 RepID=A0ABQ2L420_9BACL|nr:alpha/beta hydrolase [Saccharibacillus kuerlensis]GGO01850.1 lipase [Saccharibacillus kuerlensis]